MFTDGDEFLLLAKYTGQKKPPLAIKHLNADRPETMGEKKTTWKNEHTKGNEKSNRLA